MIRIISALVAFDVKAWTCSNTRKTDVRGCKDSHPTFATWPWPWNWERNLFLWCCQHLITLNKVKITILRSLDNWLFVYSVYPSIISFGMNYSPKIGSISSLDMPAVKAEIKWTTYNCAKLRFSLYRAFVYQYKLDQVHLAGRTQDMSFMMHWWYTDDALMMRWWCTDGVLMIDWWCFDDALMMR